MIEVTGGDGRRKVSLQDKMSYHQSQPVQSVPAFLGRPGLPSLGSESSQYSAVTIYINLYPVHTCDPN